MKTALVFLLGMVAGAMLLATFKFTVPQQDEADPHPSSPGASKSSVPDKIVFSVLALKNHAMKGDAFAARVLADWYSKQTRQDWKYWAQVGAENGDSVAQYTLAFLLFDDDADSRSLVRSVYWYRKAALQGDLKADAKAGEIEALLSANESVQDLGTQTRSALLGDSVAASALANAVASADDQRYWLQIAAQNGSAEAMQRLSAIMSEEADPLLVARADYWTRRAEAR